MGERIMASLVAGAPAIGVLLKIYPKISETFVLGEIFGLEQRGLKLRIFSLRRPTDAISNAQVQSVRAPLTYVPLPEQGGGAAILRAHVELALRFPLRYAKALLFCLRRDEGGRWRDFLQAGCLARELRAQRIVHLHAHFASEPAGIAELVQRLVGIPYSISAHAKDIYLSRPEALRRKMQGARFTVTCTQYNQRYLHQIAGEAAISCMYHGVDLDRFRPASGRRCQDQDTPLVLSVGRLREKKGFDVLIEACALLRGRGVALRCEIVGYGEEEARLRALIAARGVGACVTLTGKMTQDQVIERYARAAVFVLPCRVAQDGDRDGIPNVLLEAMAMALATVSTRVSGIPEVIEHGVNGLLVPPMDASALAEALQLVLRDPAYAAELGAAARHTMASSFCRDRNLEQVHALLRAAVQEGAGDAR